MAPIQKLLGGDSEQNLVRELTEWSLERGSLAVSVHLTESTHLVFQHVFLLLGKRKLSLHSEREQEILMQRQETPQQRMWAYFCR